jgi:hypothetical protein
MANLPTPSRRNRIDRRGKTLSGSIQKEFEGSKELQVKPDHEKKESASKIYNAVSKLKRTNEK